jgi:hypothetical protein
MLHTAIEERQTNLADAAPVVRVVPEGPAAQVALVVPEDPAAQVALVVSESPAARVALVVPESPAARVALVVSESPAARVALVVPESPAAAVFQGHLHGPAVAGVPTRWGIVAFPLEQVHAAVPSAAVDRRTEVQRGRPAVGAVIVWVEAGTAAAAEAMAAAMAVVITAAAVAAVAVVTAVVVAAAVVVVAAAVAAAGDRRRSKIMNNNMKINSSSKILLTASAVLAWVSVAPALPAAAEKDAAAAASPSNQKQFATAKEAADALVQAAASFDQAALKEILGPDSDDIIASEDPVEDKNRAMAFAAKAKEKSSLEQKGDHAILEVGKNEFPLPIPIVKQKGKWVFDTKVGKEEILNRRIGSNELDAIAIARGFDDAQKEYAEQKHDDSKVNQYAQKIISTSGKQDGLAWKNPDGTWGGPVGEGVAEALEQGYSDKTKPYHGYYFKVLKKQGPAAPGGEIDFVVGGAMIGGFGLVAAPAEYRVTGVKTFMVGPDGVVYEKDLGPDTLKTFQAIDTYNPDKTWKVTEDEWPEEDEDQGGTQ